MANTLAPRGSGMDIQKPRFVRLPDISKYYETNEEDLLAYARAAGAVYQLRRI